MKSKKFLIPALILLVVSFLSFFSGFVMIYLCRDQIFGIISMFTTGVVCLVLCIIFFEKNKKLEVIEPLPEEDIKEEPKPIKSNNNDYVSIIKKDDKDDLDEEEWLDTIDEDVEDDDDILEEEEDDLDELNRLG